MFRRSLLCLLGSGLLVGVSSARNVAAQEIVTDIAKPIDYAARIGVASVTPDLIPLAAKNLPLGFFKDYSCFALQNRAQRPTLAYMPVIQYERKTDTKTARYFVSIAWRNGQIPKLPAADLEQLLTATPLRTLVAGFARIMVPFRWSPKFGDSANGKKRHLFRARLGAPRIVPIC